MVCGSLSVEYWVSSSSGLCETKRDRNVAGLNIIGAEIYSRSRNIAFESGDQFSDTRTYTYGVRVHTYSPVTLQLTA